MQSSVGSGAAYVGLLLLAFSQFHSSWAVSLVLLADFLPAMIIGPALGAVVDRWPRQWSAVAADVIRAVAFIGLGVAGSFTAVLLLALLAGTGSALFRPAVLSGLPRLVGEPRLDGATSLYTAIEHLGNTIGPGLAAVVLAFTSPQTLMIANGVTFAISAALLLRVPLGRGSMDEADSAEGAGGSLREQTVAGIRALRQLPAARTVILASAAILAFAATINVAELVLIRDDLGAGDTGYAVVVMLYGVGVVIAAAAAGSVARIVGIGRLYLAGILIFGLAACGTALSPSIYPMLVTFALSGMGDGFEGVSGRLIVQRSVPERLMGRVFAIRDSLGAWGFGLAFVLGGLLASTLGARPVFWIAGIGALAILPFAVSRLRRDAWFGGAALARPELSTEA